MTNDDIGSVIRAAAYIEALKWARKGYRLTRYDGPVQMTADERAEFASTGIAPKRLDNRR